jgi:hypothetical protein
VLPKAAAESDETASSSRWALSSLGPWKRWRWYSEWGRSSRDRPFWKKQDDKQNREDRLPDSERVEIPAIWVVELYTPSTVRRLLQGIRSLEWDQGRFSGGESLSEWMSDVRQGTQAGWTSLGLVSPPEKPHFSADRQAPLPAGVTGALPVLMSLTPSVTALVTAFLLDDSAATEVDAVLRRSYSTFTKRDTRFRRRHVVRYVLKGGTIHAGHSIHDPNTQRRDGAEACIARLEKGCTDWVREYVPGLFASLPGALHPTAVLMLTEAIPPLTPEARRIRAFDGLSLDRGFNAWESEDWPHVRMALPGWQGNPSRLVFGCLRTQAIADTRHYYEPTSNWTIAQHANDAIPGLLARWAVTRMLDGYHEVLSTLRDKSAAAQRYHTVRDLKDLRGLVRTRLFDVEASVDEVLSFVRTKRLYERETMDMESAFAVKGERFKLLEELRSGQARRGRQVRRESELLKGTLALSSDLSETITNIRVQRLLVLLTLVSVGIAVWALVIALSRTP